MEEGEGDPGDVVQRPGQQLPQQEDDAGAGGGGQECLALGDAGRCLAGGHRWGHGPAGQG